MVQTVSENDAVKVDGGSVGIVSVKVSAVSMKNVSASDVMLVAAAAAEVVAGSVASVCFAVVREKAVVSLRIVVVETVDAACVLPGMLVTRTEEDAEV